VSRPSAEAQRKEQILRATCEVVADVGFRALRVSDVATRIGTATGTIHYYFATKRDLLHAAFAYNFERSLHRREPILHVEHDPLTKLRDLVDSYVPDDDQTVHAWRVWAELWIEAIHDKDLQVLNDEVYGEWRSFVAGLIHDAQQVGALRPGDPLIFANTLIGLLDGLSIQVILESPGMTPELMRDTCRRFLDTMASDAPVS
jgi:AcrR family transcriptional regulator